MQRLIARRNYRLFGGLETGAVRVEKVCFYLLMALGFSFLINGTIVQSRRLKQLLFGPLFGERFYLSSDTTSTILHQFEICVHTYN
jgi:hypothetical protein